MTGGCCTVLTVDRRPTPGGTTGTPASTSASPGDLAADWPRHPHVTSSLTPDWLPRDPLVPAQWINNVTYCGGSRDSCVTEMIVTVANVTMPSPGVVHHDYTDAPLSPQSEVGISLFILGLGMEVYLFARYLVFRYLEAHMSE